MNKLTQERLKELVSYDPETGIFIRKVTTAPNAMVGDVAGHVGTNGYVVIYIDGKRYKAQVLAWLYMTGAFPKNQIDHKDLVKHNNKFSNLRDVSVGMNQKNKRTISSNTSGVAGVVWHSSHGKWLVNAFVNKHRKYLGYFDSFDDAVFARYNAEIEYGYPLENSSSYKYLLKNGLIPLRGEDYV